MPQPTRIVLCVDDDPDDRDLVCYTIGEIDPSIKLVHAEDGLQAIDYLSRAKREDSLPCLVILDINMPRMDGKQTLAEIKKDAALSELPVVVFSTSNSPIDKMYCDRFGVELVKKPSNMSNMQQEMRRVLQYCAVG
jgi:CheY-like chemotaxis protein